MASWEFEGWGEDAIGERVKEALAEALEKTAEVASANAALRTGEYASTIRAVHDGENGGAIGSDHPGATAIERGADVGRRRGPHMEGQPAIRPAALDTFAPNFARAMLDRQGRE